MSRTAAMGLAAVVMGFTFGFAWGRATRSNAAGNVKTAFGGGKVTVEVDVEQAAVQGLYGFLK